VIDSAENLMRRTMVMTLYATGVRCLELCDLKVSEIDSQRMVIHVHKGKGGRDRDVLLSPKLLGTLREYCCWMKPKTYLFPRHGEQLSCRCAHHSQGLLERHEVCW
jgi:integrase